MGNYTFVVYTENRLAGSSSLMRGAGMVAWLARLRLCLACGSNGLCGQCLSKSHHMDWDVTAVRGALRDAQRGEGSVGLLGEAGISSWDPLLSFGGEKIPNS